MENKMKYFKGIKKGLLSILMVLLPVSGWSAGLRYALDVQVNTAEQKIYGKARLSTDVETTIDLAVKNLLRLNVNGSAVKADIDKNITLRLGRGRDTIISYEAAFPESGPNLINNDNVLLLNNWYPVPDLPVQYSFSATLPKGFIALSEADTLTVKEAGLKKNFRFHFDHPLDGLHLAASTGYAVQKDHYNDIAIEAYFFKEDAELAQRYIDFTRKYLALYEDMLSPYPYKRFAIVENIFPSGIALPTFTLLGRDVVKLPFIVNTSLGHEILHQWFGNFVYVDFSHGNWCEGLTSYLGDHQYAVRKNQGRAYRKKIMIDYSAYVNADNTIPLSDFYSRQSRALQAIGYGKGAMLFHEIKERYGENVFLAALREFIRQNSFRRASWYDIQSAFEKITGDKLYSYFGDRLNRTDIPKLVVKDAKIEVEQGRLLLKFGLTQQGEPYSLRVPVAIHSHAGVTTRYINIKNSEEKIILPLDEPPVNVLIDQDYSFMRHLAQEEIPPVLACVMGSEKLIVVMPGGRRSKYKPIIEALGVENIIYKDQENVTFSVVEDNCLLIAGFDNTLAAKLFGKQDVPDDGVRLQVYKNPYNPGKRILLLHVRNKKEALAVRHKIAHYGKYSELSFNNGKNTSKMIAAAKEGIHVISSPATPAIKPDSMATLDDILPKLRTSRIIYVGERHDQYAHHLNQLKVIKNMHEAGLKIGVGMEMFQVPYQQVIDDYLSGRIDERTFLEKTGYFKNWRFDYNLYKPIIDYLKQNRIPLVALNIRTDISRQVAREGIEALSQQDQKQIPKSLDFSSRKYRRDLHKVFDQHGGQAAIKDFNRFFQAQALWDEGMAEAACQFLVDNPERKLVILAGNGHIRNKYGIPERLYRRVPEPYTVVCQDEDIEPGIADYVLITAEIKGRGIFQLGVAVAEENQKLIVRSVVDKSPARQIDIRKGDVITAFAGRPVKTLADLKLSLFYYKTGEKVIIELNRGGKTLEKEIF